MAKQTDPRLSLSSIFGHSQPSKETLGSISSNMPTIPNSEQRQVEPSVPNPSLMAKQGDPRLSLSSIFGHSQPSIEAIGGISSNMPRSPNFEQNIIVAGNSIAGVLGSRYDLAAKHNINVDLQCWPNENLGTILNNLHSYIKPSHRVILLFGLTLDAWNYVPLIPNQAEPRVLLPNVNFDLNSVADKIGSFVEFCKSTNPSMKVILVIPPMHDMFQYNELRVKMYPPQYMKMLHSSPTFCRESMAQNSRQVYKKISAISNPKFNWPQKIVISCQKMLTNRGHACFNREVRVKVNNYALGKSDFLAAPEALVNGLHPSEQFIKLFWQKYAWNFKGRRSMPMSSLPQPDQPPHYAHQDTLPMNTGMDYNVQMEQSEQDRIRDQRMRLLRETMLQYEEKRKKEEKEEESPVEKLFRERVNLQKEKQKLEREKQELHYLEQVYKRKKLLEQERAALANLQLNHGELYEDRQDKHFALASTTPDWHSYNKNTERPVFNSKRFKWHSNRISNRAGMSRANKQSGLDRSQPMHPSDPPSKPPPSFRQSRPQDSHSNGGSENGLGYWRFGTLSQPSKSNSLGNYESTSSNQSTRDKCQNV